MKIQGYTSTFAACVIFVLIICLCLDYSVERNDAGKAFKRPSILKDCLMLPKKNLTNIQYSKYRKTFKSHSQLANSTTISSGSAEESEEISLKTEEMKTVGISSTSIGGSRDEIPSTQDHESRGEMNEEAPSSSNFNSEVTGTLGLSTASIVAPWKGESPGPQENYTGRESRAPSPEGPTRPVGLTEIGDRSVSTEVKQTAMERGDNVMEDDGKRITDSPSKNGRFRDELMVNVGERFRKRKEFLTNACSRLEGWKENVAITLSSRLYYSPKYQLMVCVIAKVGSTTWKNNLFQILGKDRGLEVHWHNKRIKANRYFNASQLRSFMTHEGLGTKVFTVRHPLERLVSAYRDKFQDGLSMRNPRKNGFFAPLLRQLGKTVDENHTVGVSFQEFLQFVVKEHKSSFDVNAHWRGFSKTCSPCSLSYDYILTTDTWEEDMAFLVTSLNITEVPIANHLHSYTGKGRETQRYFPYYVGIPSHLLKSIYRIYKTDFEIFNYTVPWFMRDAIEES